MLKKFVPLHRLQKTKKILGGARFTLAPPTQPIEIKPIPKVSVKLVLSIPHKLQGQKVYRKYAGAEQAKFSHGQSDFLVSFPQQQPIYYILSQCFNSLNQERHFRFCFGWRARPLDISKISRFSLIYYYSNDKIYIHLKLRGGGQIPLPALPK